MRTKFQLKKANTFDTFIRETKNNNIETKFNIHGDEYISK